MNLRGEIKKRAFDLLNGNTDAAQQVHMSRVRRTNPDDFPVILIYTTKEKADRSSRGYDDDNDQYMLSCTLEIDVLTKLEGDYELTLDTITDQIEEIILAADPRTFVANGEDLTLMDTDIDLYSGDSREPIAVAAMQFKVMYNAKITPPSTDPTESVELINCVESST